MAKVVESPDWSSQGPGAPEMYPWAEWLNGQTWALEAGSDFTTHIESMRGLVYAASYRRCGRAMTSIRDGGKTLQIQFIKPKGHDE